MNFFLLFKMYLLFYTQTYTATAVYEILTPSRLDEGRYTCLAQNSLGEEIKEVRLDVRGQYSNKLRIIKRSF